jgi:hypothetical protein
MNIGCVKNDKKEPSNLTPSPCYLFGKYSKGLTPSARRVESLNTNPRRGGTKSFKIKNIIPHSRFIAG